MSDPALRTVLVQTHHPGNIGSAARALKTMGLTDLWLVNPVDYPSEEAVRLAAGAADVLNSAVQVASLEEAVAGCRLVLACTARPRGFDLPVLDAEAAARLLKQQSQHGTVAILYGPERFGLSNEQLRLARYRVTIPANPQYPSLNLAAAVQLMSYEFHKADLLPCWLPTEPRVLPDTASMELFYAHLEQSLQQSGFINQKHPGKIIDKLRQLFARAEPDEAELNILRGMLASFQRSQEDKGR